MPPRVKPEGTAAIILGASYWPAYPAFGKTPNPVFANSAAAIYQYLIDPLRFGLHPDRVKNLFESPASAPEMHQLIANFLKPLCSEPDRGGLTDLILYYVGHGGFTGPDRQYFLAIQSTAEGFEGPSGLRAVDLATTLRTAARDVRKYLILDCCFAAAIFKEFQPAGGVTQVVGKQVADELPPKGTALLCAASKSAPAIAPVSGTYTMFSGGLREVLFNGSKTGRLHMSLHEIGKEIKDLLQEWSPDDWVRPQVLSPDAAEGDIAEVALFPNPALSTVELRHLISGLMDRTADLEKETQSAVRMAGEAGIHNQAMSRRIDGLETQAKAVDQRFGELMTADQTLGNHLSDLELQGQATARRVEKLEAVAKRLEAAVKQAPSQAKESPAAEQKPAARPEPSSAEARQPKRLGPEVLSPLAALHVSWGLAAGFFWTAIAHLDFLHGSFGWFLIGSLINGRQFNGELAYQFGEGDFTSSLILFTISVIGLPIALWLVSERTSWRQAFTFTFCWVFACIAGLICAHFVGREPGRVLMLNSNEDEWNIVYPEWLLWGTAAYFMYGLVQGLLFSLLGAVYRVISLRGATAACAVLALSSAATFVFSLFDVWSFPRFGLLAVISSVASAIVLANLYKAVQNLPVTKSKPITLPKSA